MKLALVGPVYPYRGGIAHYTTLLYRELVGRGHQVVLYSFKRQYPRRLFPGRTDRDPSVLKLVVEGNFDLDSLNPLTWWETAREIRAQRPDELILQWWVSFFAPIWIVLACVARRAGIRVTFICHNVLPHEQRRWDVRLTRWTLRLGDRFVVQSQDEKAKLQSLIPNPTVAVIPLPIFHLFGNQTLSQQEARRQLNLRSGGPVLLFFGFVRQYKGLRYLLDAVPLIQDELEELTLLVVGEFWQDKQVYLDQIERLGIWREVVLVDRYVPNEEVPVYFAAADVAVLPYLRATQSAVVQLAFALGLPVITTRIEGLTEVVTEGVNGLLVEPGSATALAEAIVSYYETRELDEWRIRPPSETESRWGTLVDFLTEGRAV